MSPYALALLSVGFLVACTSQPASQEHNLYIGTGASGPGKGFSMAQFNSETGKLTAPQLNIEAAAPSYFVIAPDHKHLYTVNETGTWNNNPTGSVSAYAIDQASGKLTLLNQQSSGGPGPCYISLDRSGKYALVANYSGGSIAVIAINADGSLGDMTGFDQQQGTSVNPERQDKAYAHSVQADPTNHFLLSCDLGDDKLYIYRFDADKGTITANNPAFASLTPGTGPRHFDFSRDGHFIYVVGEMLSTVTVFSWDGSTGTATEIQSLSLLPPGFEGENTAAEVRVHPSGKFLYATNRGSDSIARFMIDQETGKLTYVDNTSSEGKIPRNFIFDPTGKWLLVSNHGSDNGAIYSIDQETGKLTRTDVFSAPNPFCMRMN